MHLPRALAEFNRHVTNPIQRRWAGVIPWHAILEHTGRRSGRAYRTPLLCFRRRGPGPARGFVFLVGYGLESDWVRNLTAAGRGAVVHRRRRYEVGNARVVPKPEGRALLPWPLRQVARLAGEGDVVTVDVL